MKTLIVAGGGTGGHINAGLAIAEAWKLQWGDQARVLFVGAAGGLEERLVPRAGIPLQTLKLGSLKGVGFLRQLKTFSQLPGALFESWKILRNQKPTAVLGVGGYASGPMVLMARFFSQARTAIIEQNAFPGFTNRFLGRWVHRVFTAFPGMEIYFDSSRTEFVGNPIRKEMVPLPSSSQLEPVTVFVFGGSLGAMGINTLVGESLGALADLNLRWIHQTGDRDFDRTKSFYDSYRQKFPNSRQDHRVEKYIYDMIDCYRVARLVISRAGSSTLSELAAVGRASVLIPFPFATDNHQEKNARIFEKAGASVVQLQSSTPPAVFADQIRSLVLNAERVQAMEAAAQRLHRGDCASKIIAELGR
jgi:UDP-N-acetylglucosamine--N-acetylmuramyl-(pentapeptide) pyrophosphoryl-undecaprenol N-acetylglucosamine transferase